MHDIAIVALSYCCVATLAHVASASLSLWRMRTAKPHENRSAAEPVTIVRPVCGLEYFDGLTLRSTFALDHPNYEIIFCCALESDAAVPLVRRLIAEHPGVCARLLIGNDRPTANPKLNNIVKGWSAAKHDWIIIADSNVDMPSTYVGDLFERCSSDTGLVCSPPVGSRPIGFWAELECAFLNGYQARWQCAADGIGFGFAQGKSMLWKRELLDAAGGIESLGQEIAEDAAATKIVRSSGYKVRLVDRPFEQPLGPRRAKQVWDRQVRWARLRRATFPLYYVPEALTGAVLPIAAGLYAAQSFEVDPLAAASLLLAVWYGTECLLTAVAGWHLSRVSPFAWLLRDFLLPILWVKGWTGNSFTWRGNDMTVAAAAAKPACQSVGA
jgi:ceramide glucosyltransferase